MARIKSEVDLTWDRIKKGITREVDSRVRAFREEIIYDLPRIKQNVAREVDSRIRNFREELMNELLNRTWEQYAASVEHAEAEGE